MTMATAMQIEDVIRQGLPCAHVMVRGEDGQHFEAVVVSASFAGKSQVQQHQMVYQVLGERMRQEIHALSMRTLTPDAWAGNANI